VFVAEFIDGEPEALPQVGGAAAPPRSVPLMYAALAGTLVIGLLMTAAYLHARKRVIHFDVVEEDSPRSSSADSDKRHGADSPGDKAKQL